MKGRARFLDECLHEFAAKRPGVIYSDQVAPLIAAYYSNVVEQYVRPKLANPKGRIDYHKILAVTEHAIMALHLLRHEDSAQVGFEESKRDLRICELNADFAIHVAFRMFERLFRLSTRPIHHRGNFIREHKTWLMNQPLNHGAQAPVFLLAQLWWAIEQINMLYFY